MTKYSLVVRNVKDLDAYQELSDSIEEFDLEKYVFDTGAYFKKEHEAIFSCWEEQEWKNHNGQMLILSEKFPKMTFELTCQDDLDVYRIYYKDGTTEICCGEIIFEQPQKIAWDTLLSF